MEALVDLLGLAVDRDVELALRQPLLQLGMCEPSCTISLTLG